MINGLPGGDLFIMHGEPGLTPRRPARCSGWQTAWRVALAALMLASAPSTGRGQGGADDAEAREPSTPRSAMLEYLAAARDGDWATAAAHLNLRGMPHRDRTATGRAFAQRLKVVLDRTLWVDLDSLSDSAEGDTADGLPPGRDRVGTIQTRRGPVDIVVERLVDPGGAHIWLVSSATVAKIPQLYQEFGYGPLGEVLPPIVFEIRFFEVALWQWVGLLVVVVVAAFVSWAGTYLLMRFLRPIVERSRTRTDDALIGLIGGPLRLAIGVALFYLGALALALAVPVQGFLAGLSKVLVVVGVAWLLVRVTEMIARLIEERLSSSGDAAALALLPLGRKAAKAVLVGLALIAVLQNLGFNVTGILAGLGVGGLAVALAAQKTVENLFGAVTLTADQPVRVGDFCRFGDRVGTIEDIGLRSTRIRTLDRTVVSVPNSEFSALQLENFARRDMIWFSTTIGVRYETTADQLRHLLIELKKMMLAHPKVSPEPARVRFAGFGACSLDIEFFAYVRTSDWNEFLAVREDLLLRIIDIVEASGSGFAFPSQTLYLGRDGGLDEERARAAEAAVREWRERNELCLPNYPTARAAALRDTLDYPPQGSPERTGAT